MGRTRTMLAVALMVLGVAVQAAEPAPAKVDRMTDALVKMLPMGRIFEDVAAKDPEWPMQEKPEAVTADQLSCLRAELSVEGFRRSRREAVLAYAQANPSRLDAEIELLESGAAELFGKMIDAGAAQANGGPAADPAALLANADSDQMLSFVTFVSDPNFAELRKLTGFGDALSMSKSKSENEASGQQLGASLAAQQMVKAMGTCKVPPSAYM